MPTEMELTLEQTQQGVSYEVSAKPCQYISCAETLSCSQTLEDSHGPSERYAQTLALPATLKSDRLSGNPVKKILLKLNLSDHRSIITGFEGYLKMVMEVPDSSWLTRSIPTCSYPTDKHKDIMKAQSMSVQKSLPHKRAKLQDGKEMCPPLVDDLAQMSQDHNVKYKLKEQSPPSIQEDQKIQHNIFTRESQEYELKTKDKA
ncbi:hypothetical protein Tco_0924247 [Tanacetum coccineum]|uniref:Uncharacterized protein n=1 Tax=Tanacetum coccineum TaxID=301880 RepID=A0ABQ5D5H8_9ASTR